MNKATKDFTAAINGRKYKFKKGAVVEAPPAAMELFGDAVESIEPEKKEKERAND